VVATIVLEAIGATSAKETHQPPAG